MKSHASMHNIPCKQNFLEKEWMIADLYPSVSFPEKKKNINISTQNVKMDS